MTPQSVQDAASPPFFAPSSMDALWTLVTSPHPVVGKARHLGEALINAGMISSAELAPQPAQKPGVMLSINLGHVGQGAEWV